MTLDAPEPVAAKYNPDQPREPHSGEWVGTGGAVGAVRDALKLAGKIDLAPDEHLLGSGKVDGDSGGIRLALTEQHGHRMLRFGTGTEGFGQRDRENGIPAWDGNGSAPALDPAERARLNAEYDDLGIQLDDTSDPAREAELERQRDAILEKLTTEGEFNGTAKLDEYSMDRLQTLIRPALDEAVKQDKVETAAWDEIDRLEAAGNPDPARMAQLRQTARADDMSTLMFAQGIVAGSAWGDVHYEVYIDDPSQGARVSLGVWPKGAPDDWGQTRDWQGHFDAAETRKILRLLAQMSVGGVKAAAGHDVTPGHDELHHYWTKGKGLALWADSPKPWTTLVGLLSPHVGPERAKRMAAKWVHEVMGYWPGSDANRVAHGKRPRGHVVGPG